MNVHLYDIALIKVNEDFTFNENVNKVELNSVQEEAAEER